MCEAVKERAGHKCEECGIEEGTVMTGRHTGKKYILYLHAAHLDGDPSAQEPRLLALSSGGVKSLRSTHGDRSRVPFGA